MTVAYHFHTDGTFCKEHDPKGSPIEPVAEEVWTR